MAGGDSGSCPNTVLEGAGVILVCYTLHMKRTNLVLDASLLDEARRTLGAKTFSATVNLALEETIRLRKIRSLPRFFGQHLWVGNLAEMREDDTKLSGRRRRLQRHK
jgi:Arc/MetJ family transcription regulator